MAYLNKQLEEKGLKVRRVGDVYICRTKLGHLIVIDKSYDELLGENIWHLDCWNIANGLNCYAKKSQMLEALDNYLK